ncbi:MAG: RsmB/NOP family class I SAM-dependent RNA methyltransferase [Parachlamydiaceae bacterium]|nr:RsmB/NOP family class I SAM-dependent RNA methyltransferase [Parachlamydiaceae bacterium]
MTEQLPFRLHHALIVLEDYELQQLPLDLFISNYFRAHKALGSKDRGAIAESVYAVIRWRTLLDHVSKTPYTWEKRVANLENPLFPEWIKDPSIPAHIRLSFPICLLDHIERSHGIEKAEELCLISNYPAPTTIRVNTIKTTRDQLFTKWQSLYSISPCKYSENGITFQKKISLFSLPEFRDGLFEMQDEGSQALSYLVQAQPGQQVLDYCGGSGGKTLAFAPQMQGKGQIFIHDIRKHALMEAQKRLRRAGIQNAQTVPENDPRLKGMKKKMHWVLVDAPCTGTGTMRRNPDMKWRFTDETLPRLLGQQRTIFEKALSYLRPDGKIVYGTCSILREENEEQVAHFMKTYDLEMVGSPFQSLPTHGGMDGFYGVVLQKR